MDAATLDRFYFWFAISIQFIFFTLFYIHVRQEYKKRTENVRHKWNLAERKKIKKNVLDESSK